MSDTIQIIRGDDYSIPMTVTNSDGTAYNLTGSTIRFTVKPLSAINDTDDTNAVIAKVISSHSNPTEGESLITLSNTETAIQPGEYIYDMQILSNTSTKHSSLSGSFIVVNDVTKS